MRAFLTDAWELMALAAIAFSFIPSLTVRSAKLRRAFLVSGVVLALPSIWVLAGIWGKELGGVVDRALLLAALLVLCLIQGVLGVLILAVRAIRENRS